MSRGNSPYLEYVRSSVEEKTKNAEAEENGDTDGEWDIRMAASSISQYARREGKGKQDITVAGRPGLVYNSKLVESFEPTGEKVSLSNHEWVLLAIRRTIELTVLRTSGNNNMCGRRILNGDVVNE